jgi:hypothetical protein
MASEWKKLIVSGSDAELNSLYAETGVTVGETQIISSDPTETTLSGSFTGSFSGTFDGDIPAFLYVTASDGSTATVDLQTQALTLATGSTTPDNITITATGQTVTFALTDDVTITKTITASTGSILGDLVVDGNLTVSGTTTTINTTNLLVEDRFILLNSGSGASPKGGIVIDEGEGSGSALFYTTLGDLDRWSLASNLSSTATTATPDAFVAAVVDVDGGQTDIAKYQQNGNIKVEGGEVYIWVDDVI